MKKERIMKPVSRRNVLVTVTAIVAGLYVWVGMAGHGLDRLFGLLGGVLIIAAIGVASRSRPLSTVLLLVGALPLAVLTWWSLVTPVLAVLGVLTGWSASRQPRSVILATPLR